MKHTATPWTLWEPSEDDSDTRPYMQNYTIRGPGNNCISFQICKMSSHNSNEKEDAEFIVRAVNAHDDLVAALNACLAEANPFSDKVIEQARAALAKAGAA